jgi:hypothetical protein
MLIMDASIAEVLKCEARSKRAKLSVTHDNFCYARYQFLCSSPSCTDQAFKFNEQSAALFASCTHERAQGLSWTDVIV